MVRKETRAFPTRYAYTSTRHFLLFTVVFLGLCLWYGYPAIFDYAPQSTHAWRQTDGASIVYRYYMDGLRFFEPKILNVLDSDGNTIGEFPLIYYLAAAWAKLAGFQDGWLRLVNLLFLFAGLWALSRLTFLLVDDLFAALFVPLLLMTSPVLAFYGFNFLPDTAALGLIFPAGLLLYHYFHKEHTGWLIAAMAVFLLAGLTKTTALLVLLALLAVYFLQMSAGKSNRFLLSGPYKVFGAGLLVVAGVFAWISWMKAYKESHHSQYFLATINPVWDYSPEVIAEVLERIFTRWLPTYFHPLTLVVLTGLGLFTILTPKKQHPAAYTGNLFILLGAVAIFVLWFYQFHHHDYYIIILLVLPASILLCFFLYLKENHPRLLKSRILRLLMLVLFLTGAWQARQEVSFRYTPGNKYMEGLNPSFLKTEQLRDFLREKEIQYPDLAVSLPDHSPNMTLYYLRLPGWTHFNRFPELPDENDIKWDRETFTHLAKMGCKYLIVSDENWVNNPDIREVQQRPVGVFDGSVFFYDIQYLAEE